MEIGVLLSGFFCLAAMVALAGLRGFEAQAGVVGDPGAGGVAELGAESFLDFG